MGWSWRKNMKCIAIGWNSGTPGSFRRPHLILGFLVLLLCCGVAVAQDTSQPTSSPFKYPATHLLGFEGCSNNATGTLSIQDGTLRFQKSGKPAVDLKIASIQEVFLGRPEQTGRRCADDFGQGRVRSAGAGSLASSLIRITTLSPWNMSTPTVVPMAQSSS